MRLETRSNDAALVTSGWRVRAERDRVGAVAAHHGSASASTGRATASTPLDPANSGTASAGIVSPKAGATFGPWKGTEFYVNAGTGFHSNNALGTTITRRRSAAIPSIG